MKKSAGHTHVMPGKRVLITFKDGRRALDRRIDTGRPSRRMKFELLGWVEQRLIKSVTIWKGGSDDAP